MIEGRLKVFLTFESNNQTPFPAPQEKNTYLSFDGEKYIWKKIQDGASIFEYTPGQKYNKGDLIVSKDYTNLFVAAKDFISTDISSDIMLGNIKILTSSNKINFKQVNAYNKTSGETITIPLITENLNTDRLIFVIQKQNVSSVFLNPFTFNKNESKLEFNKKYIYIENKVTLKNSILYDVKKSDFYFESQDIDLSEYKKIHLISIT